MIPISSGSVHQSDNLHRRSNSPCKLRLPFVETLLQSLLHCFVTVVLFTCAIVTHAADWKPEKLIEFIVPTGPGSGVDSTSRMVKSNEWRQAVEKNQWEEHYLNSADTGKELRRQYGILKDVLGELGMVQ